MYRIAQAAIDGAERIVQAFGRFARHDADFVAPPRELRPFTHAIEETDAQGTPEIVGARDSGMAGGGGSGPSPSGSGFSDPDLNRRIGEDLAARHGIEVYGFDTPGLDTHTVREIAAATDDMLAKYPHTRHNLSVGFRQLERSTSHASTGQILESDGRIRTHIMFSEDYAKDPAALAREIQDSVREGLFASGQERRPAYSTMVHEFGHALEREGQYAALSDAEFTLRDHYSREYVRGNWTAETERLYNNWLHQLPGYCFINGVFRRKEAAAEAFTEVELNGENASEPARVLHKLMVESAEWGWRDRGLM